MATRPEDIDVRGGPVERHQEVLTSEALELVGRLHEELDDTRRALLHAREERQAELDAGDTLEFVAAPEDFAVAPVPDALQDRRVEITGPTSRKMVINALNSGARGFMADFEDANSPTWQNMVGGQVNLADAVRGSMEHEEKGKSYRLEGEHAVLLARVEQRPALRPAEWSRSSYRIASISKAAGIVSIRTVALMVPWSSPSASSAITNASRQSAASRCVSSFGM